MKTDSVDWARISDTLEGFRQELARLNERVLALEKGARPESSPQAPASRAAVPLVPESLSEEIVVVLGAAVAAFLGKRAPIRQIRLLGSTAWAQQGRVTIQASHTR